MLSDMIVLLGKVFSKHHPQKETQRDLKPHLSVHRYLHGKDAGTLPSHKSLFGKFVRTWLCHILGRSLWKIFIKRNGGKLWFCKQI